MDKIRVRLYGNENRQGKIVDFKVINELPQEGECVTYNEPEYTWGKSEQAHLDPEQRTGDDEKHREYDFYETIELCDGEYAAIHYFAVLKPLTEYDINAEEYGEVKFDGLWYALTEQAEQEQQSNEFYPRFVASAIDYDENPYLVFFRVYECYVKETIENGHMHYEFTDDAPEDLSEYCDWDDVDEVRKL